MTLIFVDVEAVGGSISVGKMTEFGAISFPKREKFHGRLYECTPDPANPAKSKIIGKAFDEHEVAVNFEKWLKQVSKGSRPVMISDNPAYDWQWINDMFWKELGYNPFGHSARRISDFYAGLMKDFNASQGWKRWRVTKHTHDPIMDSLGNVEAFQHMLEEFGIEL